MADRITWLTFNQKDVEELKEIYQKARADGLTGTDTFRWRGYILLVDYAKYFIEYLEQEGAESRAHAEEIMCKARNGELV